MNIILITQIVTFLANISLGFFILSRNVRSRINIFFWLFTMGIAAWNMALFFMLTEAGSPLVWGRLAFSFGTLGIMFIALFVIAFPYEDKNYKIKRNILLAVGSTVACIAASPLIVKSVEPINRQYIEGSRDPIFYAIFFINFLGFLLYALIRLLVKYRHSAYLQKTQLKYAILGLASFLVPTFATQFALSALGIFKYNTLGPVWTIPMIIIISYAIARHQLMDIRVAIQKSLTYSLLLSVVVALYLAILQVLGFSFRTTDDYTVIVGAAITTVIGIFTVPFIKKLFTKATDKIFYKGRYEYSQAMHELSRILSHNLDLHEMIEEISKTLRDIFRVKEVEFVILSEEMPEHPPNKKFHILNSIEIIKKVKEDKEIITYEMINLLLEDKKTPVVHKKSLTKLKKYCEDFNIDAVVPIAFEEELIGILVMGRKLSGDAYTREDVKLLKTFSYQAAVAFQKAELHEKVKEYSRELEKKVKKRTTELRKLQQEQQQMIIEISHGLRTPLSIMKLELELLKKHVPEESRLHVLETSINEISIFIHELMQLASLDAGDTYLKKSKMDLSTLMTDTAEYFSSLLSRHHIKLDTDIKKGVYILGSPEKMRELLFNIIGNSIKYMKRKGKREILLKLKTRDKKAYITIKDTGKGISKKDLPNVFERFYRTKERAHTQKEGLGLGLTIAKRIVERHNGEIDISSAYQKGTEVNITLPLYSKTSD